MKDVKIVEDFFSKDMSAQILLLSQEVSKYILTNPLTPGPLGPARINGAICSTNKTTLILKLESRMKGVETAIPDVLILDFMFCREVRHSSS